MADNWLDKWYLHCATKKALRKRIEILEDSLEVADEMYHIMSRECERMRQRLTRKEEE